MKRLIGVFLIGLMPVLFGCDDYPKNKTASTRIKGVSPAAKDASPAVQDATLNEQINKLNSELIILSEKVDAISTDYTALKASPALGLTDQVKKMSADLSKLNERVDSISAKVDSTSKDISSISAKVDSISNDYSNVAYRVTALEPGSALLNTEKEGYAIADTKFGPFIITRRGVSRYNDGYKVKLGIGNFTNATFKGARLDVAWGSHSKGFDVSDELASGAYTNVEIVLAPAGAEEIKVIRVGVELSQVYLKTK